MDKRITKALLETSRLKPKPTVKELVDKVARSVDVNRYKVARHLNQLLKEGKLKLENSQPPSTLQEYFRSVHSWWFWILAVLVALTASAIYLLPQTPPYIYFRYAAGSLFVLYLPGFALIEALFPRKRALQPLERLALSIGSSLAIIPLIGLTLNYTPWGIRLNPIFIALASFTVALAAVAVARKFSHFKRALKQRLRC